MLARGCPLSSKTANYVQAEARILKELEAASFFFSPRLLGYSSTFDNRIGFPYLVLTGSRGSR